MPPEKQPTREEFVKSLFVLESKDNIYSEKEARKKLNKGVQKGVDAVKISYGAAGSNVILEEGLYPFHKTTNDGKSILHAIKLADPVENIGLNILKEVADKSDRESGDGRKTSVVLAGAILSEGMKVEDHPMDIKRSLDECLPIILQSITDQTETITEKEVGKVATIASENKKLGALFQEMYEQIGKDGVVNLDTSGSPDTYYEIVEGVKLLNCGFQWPYMANEDKGRQAVYKYPKILISRQKISNLKELDNIFKSVSSLGRDEMVIFCEDIDPVITSAVAFLHHGVTPDGKQIQPFKTLIIKAPTLWKDWLFEDFAKITGATIVDPNQGKTLKGFRLEWLGSCDKIMTTKDETIVLGTKDIADHIKVLEDLGTDDAKIRIARLKTKTATLKLGANSEIELSYLSGKALDARNASYLALNGGVVKGAGLAFLEATKSLPKTVGGKILKEALQYPVRQIIENMDITMGEISKDISDPAIVVKNAIINALSVASTVLTSRVVITKPKQ